MLLSCASHATDVPRIYLPSCIQRPRPTMITTSRFGQSIRNRCVSKMKRQGRSSQHDCAALSRQGLSDGLRPLR